MATVNNVVMPNVVKGAGSQDVFRLIWAWTRAGKKAGWKVLASTDGTTKTVSDDPELDEWGAGAITNAGAAAASTGAIANGRMTVTGLTGIVSADKGRFLHLSGAASAGNNHYHQIEEILSATSVRVDARRTAFTPVASDANNGSISWEIRDPTTEAYPSGTLDGTAAWILMQGPSTVKVPITVAPTPGPTSLTFVRGENVTQANTSAEGEILGFVFNADTSTGYLVILPRVIGSGGDPFGWATGGGSNTITGAVSGATVDQDGTALEYRNQVVWHKEANEDSGHMYIQCIEPVGESADSFLTLAGSAGATATVQPGGGGTGNAFPTIGYTHCGDGGSSTGARWSASTATNGYATYGQVIAADAIWEEDYSADGTCAYYMSRDTSGSNSFDRGNYEGRGFYRLDNTEPGDLNPFATFGNSGVSSRYVAANRTTSGETANSAIWQANCSSSRQDDGTSIIVFWKAWIRRGLGTLGTHADGYSDFELFSLYGRQTDPGADGTLPEIGTGGPDDVVHAAVITRAREPIWLCKHVTVGKCRKGTPRHLQMLGGISGGPNTTYDGGKFVQLHDEPGAFVMGPWDETSVPRST